MKKILLIGFALALLLIGCGDAGDIDAADLPALSSTEAVPGNEPTVTSSPEPTVSAAETAPATEPVEEPAEDVNPVDGSALVPVTTKPVVTAPPTTEGVTVPPPAIEHPNPQVVTAMTDLVGRLGVTQDAIEVISVEEVTWPDGSIGCPLPGMRYTQALVNGTRIVLRVDGVDYQYNSGGGREPFYCENPSDPVPEGGGYGDI